MRLLVDACVHRPNSPCRNPINRRLDPAAPRGTPLATVAPAVAVALDLIMQLSKVVGGMPVSI